MAAADVETFGLGLVGVADGVARAAAPAADELFGHDGGEVDLF